MTSAQKVYGHNQVFCKGRFIGGPDAHSCIGSLAVIGAPSIVWLIWVGSFYAERYSGAFVAFGLLLQCSSVTLLFATAFSDPGIMPRQQDYGEKWDASTQQHRTKQPPRYYDMLLRGHPFKMKYCITCNIYRPPRCTHCSVCENCIERFDHHCPWIGNCIGKRNYWLFYCFVTTTGLLNTWTLVTALAQILLVYRDFKEIMDFGGGKAFAEAIKSEPVSAALVIYCTGTVWFTVGLCVYHNYLICTNQTTYEQIKGMYCTGHNPFHRGIKGNYADVLFSRVRPRYFDAGTGESLWPRSGKADARDLKIAVKVNEDQNGEAIDADGIDLRPPDQM